MKALAARHPDADLVAKAAAALRNEPDAITRLEAVRALRAFALRDRSLAPRTNAALVAAIAQEREAGIRYEATVGIRCAFADSATLDTLYGLMRTDPDPAVRQAAIQTLGDANPRAAQEILARLDEQLAHETSGPLQKSLLASLVRVGKADAIPNLAKAAATSPDLAGDANDFIAALKTGETDMDRLWDAKVRNEIARLGPSRGH